MSIHVTLITGASSGIGLHLAEEFASHGHNLFLVAPDQGELAKIAVQLKTRYKVEVDYLARNLEQSSSSQRIREELEKRGMIVEILVNNAGLGFWGKTWEIPLEDDLATLRLNIEAVLRLTKVFLPGMIERGRGWILNTASVAGFEPGPLLNVYHASKAFVLSWSEGLAVELENTGVIVTALCPGPTDTDFFPKAGMEKMRVFQQARVMAPQEVARVGYEALMDAKLFVVPGAVNKALVMARRILSEESQAKFNRMCYEEAPPGKQAKKRGDWESQADAPAQDRGN